MSSPSFRRGRRISSVDDRNDLRVSDNVSEMNELDRRPNRELSSANVVALPSGRSLNPWGDGLTPRPVGLEEGRVMEGLFSEAMTVSFHSSATRSMQGECKWQIVVLVVLVSRSFG